MPAFAQINRIVAFLRSEDPTEDISTDPIVAHPHNTSRTIPARLPPAKLKELSALLMQRNGFQAHAVVRRSLATSLGECIKP